MSRHPAVECLTQLLGRCLDPPIRQGSQLDRIGLARAENPKSPASTSAWLIFEAARPNEAGRLFC
jgi:hypothetical protein